MFDAKFSSSYLHTDSKAAIELQSKKDAFNLSLSKQTVLGSTIGLNYSQNINDNNPPLTIMSSSAKFEASTGVSFSQNLLKDFGTKVNTTKIFVASKIYDGMKYNFLQDVLNTIYNVQVAYWNFYEAQKNYELETYGLTLLEELLKQKEKMVELGGFPKALIQEIVASRADVLTRMAITEKNLKINEINFESVLGSLDDKFEASDLPFEYSINNSEDESAILEKHPEILANKTQADASRRLLSYYDNQLLPSLNVGIDYSLNNPSPEKSSLNPYTKDHDSFSTGLKFSMPIDNSSAIADLARTRLSLMSATAKEDKIKYDIKIKVKKALLEIDTIKNIVNFARNSVEAQEKIMLNEDKKLELGLTTMKNYLDNMNSLIIRKKQLLSFECDMMRSFASYFEAIGRSPEFLNINLSEYE